MEKFSNGLWEAQIRDVRDTNLRLIAPEMSTHRVGKLIPFPCLSRSGLQAVGDCCRTILAISVAPLTTLHVVVTRPQLPSACKPGEFIADGTFPPGRDLTDSVYQADAANIVSS